MPKIRGGQAVAKVLKNEGVKYLFTLPVTDYAPLFAGCIDEGIKIISVRHEQAAAYIADAWGRVTREPGICLAIGGCGATNMATALVGAYYECSPVIALLPLSESGLPVTKEGESQQFNASRMFEPYIKWGRLCTDASELTKYIRWAYRHATTGRMGPVLLEMPTEIFFDQCDPPELVPPERYRVTARPYVDTELAKKAVKMLISADRPLIIVGNGVHWSDAWPELKEFAQLVNVPVVSKAGLAQGYFPEDHPLYAGVCIAFNRPCLPAQIAPKADVVMTIGSRFELMSAFPQLSEDAKLIQVDIEPSEIGRHRYVDLGIVGDAKAVLHQFAEVAKEMLPLEEKIEWLKYVKEEREKYEESLLEAGLSTSKPIKPARLVREIRDFLEEDAYVIINGADIGSMGRTYLRARLPGHFMIAHGDWGNMGPGIPFALGAKLARPQNQVLLLTSDGSFGLNAMEMETASKYGIQMVCVISNNLAWGAEQHPGLRMLGDSYTEKIGAWFLEKTRYDKLAEALGCYGELVVDPEEIRPALKRAFDSGLPAVLDVRVETKDMWPTRTSLYTPLPEYISKRAP